MLKYLQDLFRHFPVMRFTLIMSVLAMSALTGCAHTPSEPVVITKNVVIAPADNLLVDCDIAPPPAKAAYVKTSAGVDPNQTLQKNDAYYLTQYANTIKVLQERERALTEHALKQFQNLDTCNKRWKALREWKATATQQLSAPQKE